MEKYKIISDSSCEISPELQKKLDVDLVPFSVSFDGSSYYKENVEITTDGFYSMLKDKAAFPRTSQPLLQDYIDTFEKYIKTGRGILCICLSGNFSGSYQCAVNAKNMLEEEYPSARIDVFDSRNVTGTQHLLVREALAMQEKGFSQDEVLDALEKIKNTSKINFTVDSLEHLQKGGRIGKASALAGTLLNIKPIIVAQYGELFPESKVRGHKKALRTILKMTTDEIGGNKEEYRLVLLYGNDDRKPAAQELADILIADGYEFSDPPLAQVGVTIGTHAGPTAIGIAYIKKHDAVI